MGFIKRFRARHEERRRLYDNIIISHKAIRRLVVTDIFVGYKSHTEEVRALYREMIEQVSRFADIIKAVNLLDTMFHGDEMRKQVKVVKHYDDEIRNLMFSQEEQTNVAKS